MLIQKGIQKNTLFGIHLRAKAPDFHEKFGTADMFPDINRDSGLTNFNQNLPNTVFNTPPQPNGCTGMCTADIMTDLRKVIYSPWFSYVQACQLAGVSIGSEIDIADALNEPQIAGLQALDGSITKTGLWYEVKPLNGSLFQGVCSALTKGQSSVSFASTWFSSFDTPINGVVLPPSGTTSGHNWKFCGIKTINGVQYLIAKPWLGNGWGENGFCYFSQSIVDKIGGQAFTPVESEGETPFFISTENILESIINLLKLLLDLQGAIQPTSMWGDMDEEMAIIEQQFINLTKTTMTPEQILYQEAKKSLGKHMTLNNTVPAETGCAEAVSAVLKLAGVSDGPVGIAGTASLYAWLTNSSRFVKIDAPEEGAIIISQTGAGNGRIEGHTGILGALNAQFPNDYGIMSNDSATGLFLETWSLNRWNLYYGQAGSLPVTLFRLV